MGFRGHFPLVTMSMPPRETHGLKKTKNMKKQYLSEESTIVLKKKPRIMPLSKSHGKLGTEELLMLAELLTIATDCYGFWVRIFRISYRSQIFYYDSERTENNTNVGNNSGRDADNLPNRFASQWWGFPTATDAIRISDDLACGRRAEPTELVGGRSDKRYRGFQYHG